MGSLNVLVDGNAQLATGYQAAGNYFTVIGVPAVLGCVFAEADDRPSAPPVAVISHAYWNKRFGSIIPRLSRNVGQPDHILANPIVSQKAERRPGPGEIWFAVTEHDGVQVDSILIDQAKFGQALRQVRASNFDLPVALGLQLADRALEIIIN